MGCCDSTFSPNTTIAREIMENYVRRYYSILGIQIDYDALKTSIRSFAGTLQTRMKTKGYQVNRKEFMKSDKAWLERIICPGVISARDFEMMKMKSQLECNGVLGDFNYAFRYD